MHIFGISVWFPAKGSGPDLGSSPILGLSTGLTGEGPSRSIQEECFQWKPSPPALLSLAAGTTCNSKAFCLYIQDSVLFLPSDSGNDITPPSSHLMSSTTPSRVEIFLAQGRVEGDTFIE